MQYFSSIPIWENKRRLQMLNNFRSLVTTYYDHSNYSWMAEGRIEEDEAKQARTEINLILHDVHKVIIYSGVPTLVQYTPPPVVGGYIQNLDVIQNMFILHQFQMGENSMIDIIDRSIGIYQSDQSSCFRRTINPFWWIGKFFAWLVSLPFKFLGTIGFSQKKAENSLIGKMFKRFLYFITALASLLTILNLLGILDRQKEIPSEKVIRSENKTVVEPVKEKTQNWLGDKEEFLTIYFRNKSKHDALKFSIHLVKGDKQLEFSHSKSGSYKGQLSIPGNQEIPIPVAPISEIKDILINEIGSGQIIGYGFSPELPEDISKLLNERHEKGGVGYMKTKSYSLGLVYSYKTIFDDEIKFMRGLYIYIDEM